MLSEFLISCSGTRQAAVLLHWTKPPSPERTDNKTFKSAEKTLLSRVTADAFEMNSLCTRADVVADPPLPPGRLRALPCVHTLQFRSAEQLFLWTDFSVFYNNLRPSRVVNSGSGDASCPLLVHACLSVHLDVNAHHSKPQQEHKAQISLQAKF